MDRRLAPIERDPSSGDSGTEEELKRGLQIADVGPRIPGFKGNVILFMVIVPSAFPDGLP